MGGEGSRMDKRLWSAILGLSAAGSLLALGTANAAWPTWGGDTSHSMTSSQPLPAPLAVHWKFAAAQPGTSKIRSGVVLEGKNCYFGSKNVLYCIDAESGELKWRQP